MNATLTQGKVTQVIGPVVDVTFESDLPDIFEALEIDGDKVLTLEVQQHLGSGVVRAVAMGPTEGLARHTKVRRTKAPIKVPVGRAVLGRMLNVLGEA